MQEEITQKTLALCVQTGKMTAQLLQQAMKKVLADMEKHKNNAKCKASPFPLCAFNLTLTLLLDKESPANPGAAWSRRIHCRLCGAIRPVRHDPSTRRAISTRPQSGQGSPRATMHRRGDTPLQSQSGRAAVFRR